MATSKPPAAGRRKKKLITYEKKKPASLAAPWNFEDDTPPPKRPRNQADGSHGSLERYGNKFGASNTLSSGRATPKTLRNIFDGTPNDDEPTPRPPATPVKKSPPEDGEFDDFDVTPETPVKSTGRRRAVLSTAMATLPEHDPKQASRTRAAKIQMPEHSSKQASYTRLAKRPKLEHHPEQASYAKLAKRPKLDHHPEQASYINPPIEWSVEELINWIQQRKNGLIESDEYAKLRSARIASVEANEGEECMR
jgi:hypothetical protein